MRFIHTADSHLGASPSRRLFKRHEDYLKRLNECEDALFKVFDYAIEHALDAMALAGDVFDHPRVEPRLLKRLENALNQFAKPVIMILGNHDAFVYAKRFPVLNHPHLHLLTKAQPNLVIGDVTFIGQATQAFDLDTLKRMIDVANTSKKVILLHGDVSNKKDDHYLTSLNQLKKLHADYIALGHIHQHQKLTDTIVYSGNLEPMDPSEIDDKGFMLIDLDKHTHTFVPSSTRQMHHITVACEGDEDDVTLTKKILESSSSYKLSHDLFRFVLEGYKPLQAQTLDRVESRLDEQVFAYEIKDERQTMIDYEALKQNYQNTLIETLLEDDDGEDGESLALALEALLETEGRR